MKQCVRFDLLFRMLGCALAIGCADASSEDAASSSAASSSGAVARHEPAASSPVAADPSALTALAELRTLHPGALPSAPRDPPPATPPAGTGPAWRPLARQATVALPARADGEVTLEDTASGMRLRVRLRGARPVEAQSADGYRVYADALADAGGTSATLLLREGFEGFEDHVAFAATPRRPELRYEVEPGDTVAGLRLVDDVLEFLDARGTPGLRMRRPWAQSGATRVRGTVAVEGCAVSTDPAPPWGRAVVPHGARDGAPCLVVVRWEGLPGGPVLVDPEWTTTGSLTQARYSAFATQLGVGVSRALVLGGRATLGGPALSSAEVFDVGSGTFAATSPGPTSISQLVTRTDGRVLAIVPTTDATGPSYPRLFTYNPAGGVWTGPITSPIVFYPANFLRVRNGFVAKGDGRSGGQVSYFNDTLDTWTPMSVPTGMVLPDGRTDLPGGIGSGIGSIGGERALLLTDVHRLPPAPDYQAILICDPRTLACTLDRDVHAPFHYADLPPTVSARGLVCARWRGSDVYCAENLGRALSASTVLFYARAFIYDGVRNAWRTGPATQPLGSYFNSSLVELENGDLLNTFPSGVASWPGYAETPWHNADSCEGPAGPCVLWRMGTFITGRARTSIRGGYALLAGGIPSGTDPMSDQAELWVGCNRNNRAESGEACDGADLRGQTCSDFGFTRGALSCNTSCEYVITGCSGLTLPDAGPIDVPAADVPMSDRPSADATTTDATVSDGATMDASASDAAGPVDAASDTTLDAASDGGPDASTGADVPNAGDAPVCTVEPGAFSSATGAFLSFETPEVKFDLPGVPFGFKTQLSYRRMFENSGIGSSRPCLGYSSATCEGIICVKTGAETCFRLSGQASASTDYERVCTTPPRWRCDTSQTTCVDTQARVRVGVTYQPMEVRLPLGPLMLELVATIGANGQVSGSDRTGRCVCAAGDHSFSPAFGLTFATALRTAKLSLFGALSGSDENYRAGVEFGICASVGGAWRWGCAESNDVVVNSGIRIQTQVTMSFAWIRIAPYQWTTGYTYTAGAWSNTPRASCF